MVDAADTSGRTGMDGSGRERQGGSSEVEEQGLVEIGRVGMAVRLGGQAGWVVWLRGRGRTGMDGSGRERQGGSSGSGRAKAGWDWNGRVGRAVRLGGQAGWVHGDLDFWSG